LRQGEARQERAHAGWESGSLFRPAITS
jgi:hypothetical protein